MRLLELDIDPQSGTVWRHGEVVDLPDLSFRLLMALVERAPALVSKDELIAAVWGDVVVSDETLTQRVRLLRQAIGDDSQEPRYFAAVRGRGYRLLAPVNGPGGEAPATRHRHLLAAAILMVVALLLWQFIEPGGQQIDTLAVLPFDDMSEEANYGFFAAGMQEELLARLSQASNVAVLSRTSVDPVHIENMNMREIAEKLDVDALIEGSVRVTGDQLRITVQLIDGRTDQHIWAETYDSALSVEDIFEIQSRVADSIANSLALEFRIGERFDLPTTNLEAYNLYLLGRHHTFQQTEENLDEAVRYLRAAIELDPGFAEAYAALGWALSFQGTGYGRRVPGDVYPLAREAALKALELDDTLADARSLYADILTWYDWDFDLAESEYRRTLALDPLNVLGYALFLSSQGRHDEAIEQVMRRVRADPDDRYVLANAAWRYLQAGRYREARDAATLASSHPDAASVLGFAELELGNPAVAITVLEEDLRAQGREYYQLTNLAYAYFRVGKNAEGRELLEEIESIAEGGYVSPVPLAAIHVAAGDRDRAIEFLEAALDARDRGLIFLRVANSFRDLHGDPRFEAIADEVGLPSVAQSSTSNK